MQDPPKKPWEKAAEKAASTPAKKPWEKAAEANQQPPPDPFLQAPPAPQGGGQGLSGPSVTQPVQQPVPTGMGGQPPKPSDLYSTPLTGGITAPQAPSLQRSVGVESGVPIRTQDPTAPSPAQQFATEQKIKSAEFDAKKATLDIYHRARFEKARLRDESERLMAMQDQFKPGTPQWEAHQKKMGATLDQMAYAAKRERELADYAEEEMRAIVSDVVSKKADQLSMERDGVGMVADPSKIQAEVDRISQQYGVRGGLAGLDTYGDEFRRTLYDRLKNAVDVAPKQKRADEIFQKEADIILEREGVRFKEGFKADAAIRQQAESRIAGIKTEVEAAMKQDNEQLLAGANEVYATLTAPIKGAEARLEQAAVQIQHQIELGVIPYEQGVQMLEQAQQEYAATYEQYKKDWETTADDLLRKSSALASRYNQRYQEQQRAILDAANKDIAAAAELYAKEFRADPMLQERLNAAYKGAWAQAQGEDDARLTGTEEARRLAIKQFSPVAAAMDVFTRNTITGLGGAFKGISTTLGFDGGYQLGEEMERAFYTPQPKSKKVSDLLDPMNFSALSGQLLGAMTPSLGASIATAYATGGTGTPVAVSMVTTALAGWGVETMDIAGRAKDQMLAKTGSMDKANEAWEKSLKSQVQLLPAYAFDGLPFVGKALKGVPTIGGRVAVGAGVEYVTETFQEIPQNIAERNILAGKEAWDDFAEGLMDPENKEVLIAMAPIALLGGGGQITSQSAKKEFAQAVKGYIGKGEVAKHIEGAESQWLAQMTVERGDKFAHAVLASLHQGGHINEQQLAKLEELRIKAMEHRGNAIDAGLNDREAGVYTAFSAMADDLRTKAESSTNPIERMLAKARLGEIEGTLKNFVLDKEADYVTVTYPDGKTSIMDAAAAKRMLQSEEFLKKASLLGLTKDGLQISGNGAESSMVVDQFTGQLATVNDRIAAWRMDPAAAPITMQEVTERVDEVVGEVIATSKEAPKGTPDPKLVEVEWSGKEVEAETLKPDPVFLASNSRDADIGRVVTYQGVEGILAKNDDGYFVVTPEEDIVVEGGLSEATNEELGLTARLTQPDIELDLTKVEMEDTGVDPNAVLTDFGDGRIAYRGSDYTYVRTNLDNNGNEASVTVLDADGKEKTIRNKQAVEEIVLQKLLYEDWTGKQPTTNEITTAAAELGLEERAPVPAKADKGGPRKVQPKRPDKTAQAPKEEVAPTVTPKQDGEVVLNTLNPTGSVFSNYSAKEIDSLPLGENITTYDKTANINPDQKITVYRGVPDNVEGMVSGDFVTTNKQLAKDYAGGGKVISAEVRADEILDDTTEPLGEEYILRRRLQPTPAASLTPIPNKPTPTGVTPEPEVAPVAAPQGAAEGVGEEVGVKPLSRRKRQQERKQVLKDADNVSAQELGARGAVVRYLASGGRVGTESLIKELGLRDPRTGKTGAELRSKVWAHNKGADSIERVAEKIAASEGLDEMKVRNELIDALNSASGRNSLIEELRAYLPATQEQMEADYYGSAVDEDAWDEAGATEVEKERAEQLYAEAESEWSNYTDEQKQAIFDEHENATEARQADDTGATSGAKGSGTTRAEEGAGGEQVEAQVDPRTRTERMPLSEAASMVTKQETEEILKGSVIEGRLDTYAKRVAANLKYMGTPGYEWKAVPFTGERVQDKSGKSMLPQDFSVLTGGDYKSAPTLFPNGNAMDNMNCEWCGKGNIKEVFTIFNEDKKWTLSVGNECVGHFAEGVTGKEMGMKAAMAASVSKWKALAEAQSEFLKVFRLADDIGYGRTQYNWTSPEYYKLHEEAKKLTGRLDPEESGMAAFTKWEKTKGADAEALTTKLNELLVSKESWRNRIRIQQRIQSAAERDIRDLERAGVSEESPRMKDDRARAQRAIDKITEYKAQIDPPTTPKPPKGETKETPPEVEKPQEEVKPASKAAPISDKAKADPELDDLLGVKRQDPLKQEGGVDNTTKSRMTNEKAINLLKSIAPDLKIITHKDQPSLSKAYGRNAGRNTLKSETATTKGFYDTARKEIHIGPFASQTTLAHEVMHPLFRAAFAENPEAVKRLYNELLKDPDFAPYIEHGNKPSYKAVGEERVMEEAIVQFMAGVYEGKLDAKFKADRNFLQKVRDFIKDMMAKLGLRKSEVNFSNIENLKQMAGLINEAMRTGATAVTDKVGAKAADIAMQEDANRLVDGWYSRLDDAVAGKGNTQSGDSWMKWAEARAKEGMLSMEEVKWTGLADFLQGKAKVTPQEVRAFLKDNRVKVEVKVLGDKVSDGVVAKWWNDQYAEKYPNLEWSKLNERQQDQARIDYAGETDQRENRTKFSQYQLPGGTNYREVLVTLPRTDPFKKSQAKVDALTEKMIAISTQPDTLDLFTRREKGDVEAAAEYDKRTAEYKALQEERDAIVSAARSGKSGEVFKTSHFPDNDNVLFHLRLNDRVDADGKKALFIEEIQSDWAQKGRKEGFFDEGRLTALDEKLKKDGQLSPEEAVEYNRLVDMESMPLTYGGVPVAPFVTSTDAWAELAIKQAIRIAVEGGYDRVAWTEGKVHTDRWGTEEIKWKEQSTSGDLVEVVVKDGKPGVSGGRWKNLRTLGSVRADAFKSLDKQEYLNEIATRWGISPDDIEFKKSKRTFFVEAKQQSGGVAGGVDLEAEADSRGLNQQNAQTVSSAEELEKAIAPALTEGQDAKKLAEKLWQRMQAEESGVSMPRKEGFEGFYDKIVPAVAAKVIKKMGGGKVGETDLGITAGEKSQFGDGPFSAQDAVVKKRAEGVFQVWVNGKIRGGNHASEAAAMEYIKSMAPGQTQPSFDITPDMRAKVGMGVPLMAQGTPKEIAEAFKKKGYTEKTAREYMENAGVDEKTIEGMLGRSPEPQLAKPPVRQAGLFPSKTDEAGELLSGKGIADPKAKKDMAILEQQRQENERARRGKGIRDWYVRNFEDTAGMVKEAVKNVGGHKAVRNRILQGGASAAAKQQWEKFSKEIYKGLSASDEILLNDVIQAMRTISIDQRRDSEGQPRPKHTGGITKESQEVMLAEMRNANPELMKKIERRANAYFDANRELLKYKLDEGRISPELYNKLASWDYAKRAYLHHVEDTEMSGGKSIYGSRSASSDIKALGEGSEEALFNDFKYLLKAHTLSTFKTNFENRSNREIGNMAATNPSNGLFEIVKPRGFNKQTGQPIYPKPKTGNDHIVWFDDGVMRVAEGPADMVAQWNQAEPIIKQNFANAIRLTTGGSYMRFMLTGANPAFALANIPRDIGHVLLLTDVYSPVFPVGLAQLGADMAAVAKDATSRSGLYQDYIKYGGGMDFLSTQGRPLETAAIGSTNLSETYNKAMDVLGYLNETSELIIRLALYRRGFDRGTKKFEAENGRKPDSKELDQINMDAVAESRNQMDFGQGGSAAKAIDNFLPYTNAALQGTRVLARYAKSNPAKFGVKLAQLGSVAIAIALSNILGYPDDWEELPDEIKSRYFIFFLPLTVTDKNGQVRRKYVSIAKSHEQIPFAGMFEGLAELIAGREHPTERLWKDIENGLPGINITKVPIIDAINAYVTGYDTYSERFVYKPGEIEPWREYREGSTPSLYQNLGRATASVNSDGDVTGGISPERAKLFMEKLGGRTEGNMFYSMAVKSYSSVTEAMGINEREELDKTVTEHINEMAKPFRSRIIKETYPRSKSEDLKEETRKGKTNRVAQNDKVRAAIIKRHAEEDKRGRAEIDAKVIEWIKTQPQYDQKRLMSRYRDGVKMKGVDYWYIALKNSPGISPETKALSVYTEWSKAKPAERKEIVETINKVGGISSDRFNKEFARLRREYGDQPPEKTP
jgi:hypothetical protein